MPVKMKRRPLPGVVVFASLPGPDRQRTLSPYCYRMTYRNPDAESAGCVLSWEVLGGRNIYQIALERAEDGGMRYHCTCADAVYRGEDRRHVCKHVQGLLALGRPRVQPLPTPA
jgi:hypothetical protein